MVWRLWLMLSFFSFPAGLTEEHLLQERMPPRFHLTQNSCVVPAIHMVWGQDVVPVPDLGNHWACSALLISASWVRMPGQAPAHGVQTFSRTSARKETTRNSHQRIQSPQVKLSAISNHHIQSGIKSSQGNKSPVNEHSLMSAESRQLREWTAGPRRSAWKLWVTVILWAARRWAMACCMNSEGVSLEQRIEEINRGTRKGRGAKGN